MSHLTEYGQDGAIAPGEWKMRWSSKHAGDWACFNVASLPEKSAVHAGMRSRLPGPGDSGVTSWRKISP